MGGGLEGVVAAVSQEEASVEIHHLVRNDIVYRLGVVIGSIVVRVRVRAEIIGHRSVFFLSTECSSIYVVTCRRPPFPCGSPGWARRLGAREEEIFILVAW